MIIAQISDTHIALDTPDADQRIRDFERTVSDINKLNPQPDIILHTGDIVQNGTPDEYSCASGILAKANAPTYVMVGNKDDRINLRSAFSNAKYLKDHAEFITYTIEKFPVRLIVLDTLNPGSNKGDLCEERISKLVDMISSDTTKPIAVFAHHPPFLVDEGPEPLHFETNEKMQQFRQILKGSTSIINIFCGHVHRGVAGRVGNIPTLVMPCIATTLRRGEYPPNLVKCPIYHVHKYEPEWGFTTELRIVNFSN